MVIVCQKTKTKKGEEMKNIVISSILALAVISFSGCSTKSASCNVKKPTLPACVSTPCAPAKKIVPCPCP